MTDNNGWEDVPAEDSGWEDIEEIPEGASVISDSSIQEADESDYTVTITAEQDSPDIVDNKISLIDEEYTSKKKRLEDAKKANPDMTDVYDVAMNRLEQDRIDKQRKEQETITKRAKALKEHREQPNALDRTTASGEAILRGAYRPVLGVMRLAEGLTDGLGLTDEDSSEVQQWIIDNEDSIQKTLTEAGIDPEGMNISDLGQLLTEISPLGIASKVSKALTIGKSAMIEGVASGASEFGSAEKDKEGKLVPESPSSAIGTGLATAGMVYGGAKAFGVIERLVGDLSYEAKLMLKKANKTPEEVADILDGVPKKEQAKKIAEAFGGEFTGSFKQAIADSDDVRRKVTTDINARAREFEEGIGTNDFDKVEKSARRMYKSLETQLKRADIQTDVSDLTEGFKRLKNFGREDETLLGKIESLGNEITDNPSMDATRLLEMRSNLNEMLRKFKGKNSTAYDIADEMKSRVDDKIKTSLPDDLHKMFDDTMDNYGIYKEQEVVQDILKKNKKDIGYGQETEKIAYNYGGILKSLREENLLTKEGEESIKMIEQMNRKFGNDFDFFSTAKTAGESTKGGVLGLWGAIINSVKVPIAKTTGTEFAENIYIQEAIEKAIKTSDSGAEFAKKIAVNKDIADNIKSDLIDALGNIRTRNTSERNMMKFVKSKSKALPPPSDYQTRVFNSPLYGTQKGGNIGDDISEVKSSREMQNRREKARRGREVVEGELIDEDTTPLLENKKVKTPTKDIEDVEIISYGNKPKRLTESQAKEWNSKTKEITSINKKIDSLSRAKKALSKSKLTKAKKDKLLKKYESEQKELRSKAEGIKKKLPKS